MTSQIVIPRVSATIPGAQVRIVAAGDSLTDIFGPEGTYAGFNLAQQLSNDAIAHYGAQPFAPGIRGGKAAGGVQPLSAHKWFNVGKTGYDCIDMLSNGIPAQIAALKPDIVLWCLFGRNCVFGRVGTGVPSVATCTANHLTIAQQILSDTPGCQLLMTSPVCENEQWPNGANTNDPEMNQQDTIQQGAAGTAGAVYFSLRQPGTDHLFEKEQVVNPTELNVGVLSVDGVHLWHKTTPPPAAGGQQWACGLLRPLFRFA